jgi:hypothetical protein
MIYRQMFISDDTCRTDGIISAKIMRKVVRELYEKSLKIWKRKA